MAWLAGMRLLELTLRRLVLLDGSAREWEKRGEADGHFDAPQFTVMPLEEMLDGNAGAP